MLAWGPHVTHPPTHPPKIRNRTCLTSFLGLRAPSTNLTIEKFSLGNMITAPKCQSNRSQGLLSRESQQQGLGTLEAELIQG